ncbi:MAG TPA: DUF3500 domain-containing protein [Woeseiaceae bacterium]|nr:DUF3500 domain-containing protein [Woeseiaceae bacterium]
MFQSLRPEAAFRRRSPGGAALLLAVTALVAHDAAGQQDRSERFQRMSEEAEKSGLAEPFEGVTANGQPVFGLFPVESTGVSTAPVVAAATAFLDALPADQRERTTFPVDDPEWRKWMNQHFYVRQGVSFQAMSDATRRAALDLLEASLSAEGLQLTRDVMRLNHTLGELNGDNFEEFGEWLYWITVMGEPSASEPWGWQLDGHHAVINYFVLGDQVVMSPVFMGSEPTIATSGRYAGTEVLQDEQAQGLSMLQSLSGAQRQMAIIEATKDGNDTVAEAFSDNVVLENVGIPASLMDSDQRSRLLALIELYVGNLRDGHADVKMADVEAHLDDTYFAWIGGSDDDSVYYYRIFSPVILIEFDHQSPANLRHRHSSDRPTREHIHTVVRTPNGNDYGKDLLRQHYAEHPHD